MSTVGDITAYNDGVGVDHLKLSHRPFRLLLLPVAHCPSGECVQLGVVAAVEEEVLTNEGDGLHGPGLGGVVGAPVLLFGDDAGERRLGLPEGGQE